jgi:hypothetical protein
MLFTVKMKGKGEGGCCLLLFVYASASDTKKRNTRYAIAGSINAVGQLLSNNLLFARGSVYL